MNYNDIFRGKGIYSNLSIIPLLGKHQNINIGILFRTRRPVKNVTIGYIS